MYVITHARDVQLVLQLEGHSISSTAREHDVKTYLLPETRERPQV